MSGAVPLSRPFKFFLATRLLGTLANQMLLLALGWQMYDLTERPLDLGLVGLFQFLPSFLLTIPAGQLVDAIDRRFVLAMSLALQSVVAVVLAWGSYGGWVSRELILGLGILLGAARALQAPALQALVPTLVPADQLSRAVSMSSAAMKFAVIAGPAIGGFLYATGVFVVYAVCVVFSGFSLVTTFAIAKTPKKPRDPMTLASMFAGWHYIRTHPVVLGAISLDLFAVLLGGATALLPIYARDILATGPWGLGLLRGAPAVGALIVGFVLARVPMERHVGRRMFIAVAIYGLSTLVFAYSHNFALSLVMLAIGGAGDMVSVIVRQTLVQIQTPDELRGRVSGVNSTFISASNQLGEFRSGTMAQFMGAPGSVVAGALGTIAIVGIWMRVFPQLARMDRWNRGQAIMKIDPEQLRSHRWFGRESMRTYNHRSRMAQMGVAEADYRGKPVIAIVNTWSEINPCHQHFRTRAEEVKRGVWQAGGFPLEMPAMSIAEIFQKPSPLMYRNFLAMETEELLRSYPVDGAVLMGGCDKTTPGLAMGAISMGLPFIFMPAGPMLKGNASGVTLGSGTDMFKGWSELRAGTIDQQHWEDLLLGIARSPGTCMTMGTAATMMSAMEALGLTLPGASSIPAPDSAHARMATASGKRIVDMVWEDLKPAKILTDAAFDNAVTCVLALGGSTNALVHLVAMARRAGCSLDLDRFDALARVTPLIANIRPAGKYLMEDFHYAGGLRAMLERIRGRLRTDALTVNGATLGENIAGARVFDDEVILALETPLVANGSLAVLRGNLAPDGAVIKPAAAEARLHRHRGRAIVFESYAALALGIDDPALEVDENSVLVLQNAGPLGGPGMPEWGQLPIPQKLLQKGVRDMLRISDCRMSGTSFGACVLHVAPEAYIGGPLALVRTGDEIEIDIPARTLTLHVPDDELARRRAAWTPPPPRYTRGYGAIFQQNVTQANEGCDFAVLAARDAVPDPDIY